jgi:hypothetical protein
MAIKPLNSKKLGEAPFGSLEFKRIQKRPNAQRVRSSVFLRPCADALDGDPQQTSCEESVVRLRSFAMGSAIESLHYQSH